MRAHARRHLLVVAAAGIWLAANLAKPITLDDAAYYQYAKQIASHPADPYGFAIIWYQTLQPAIEVMAPPVWPGWWAAGLQLLGDREWAWKLWQFPFVCLFVASCAALARRFAREPMGDLLPVFIVLSPVFLPSLNMMLDVPALALGLAGFVLFLKASDKGSASRAVLAGLVVGLAMQTKYTAALVPAVMMVHAAFFGARRIALVAAGCAAAVFGSWEAAMLWRYGQSQFVDGLLEPAGGLGRTLLLVPALVTLAGGVGSAWGFLGLTALRVRRPVVVSAAVASAGAFLVLGWLPSRVPISLPGVLAATIGRPAVHLNGYLDLFRLLGILVAVVMATVLVRLWREPDRTSRFLVAWLALEIAGYLLLNPFAAVRRVMGLAVPATLAIGRLAGRAQIKPTQRQLARAVVVYGAVLAALFAAADRADAIAQRDAAAQAAAAARAQAAQPAVRLWYVGHWGFQYYAERAGMEPVVPGASLLRAEDMLIVPGPPVDAQRIAFPASRVAPVAQVAINDVLPWRTIPGYYRGAVPLASRPPGPRLSATVYRVLEEFAAEAQPSR